MPKVAIYGRPTIRRVRNRGFTPIQYHGPNRIRYGWVYAEDAKWIRAYFPGDGRKRLPKSEGRYIKER